MKASVLLAGVERPQRGEMEHRLWALGAEVRWVDRVSARAAVRSERPSVVVVDRSGAGLLSSLAEVAGASPVLDASGIDVDSLVEAIRSHLPLPAEVVLGSSRVQLDVGLVQREDRTLKLTRIETSLLRFMLANADRVVSNEELLRKVWGYRPGTRTRTVTTTIYRLRHKIEADPKNARFLQSRYGRGYQLVVPAAAGAEERDGNLEEAPQLVGRDADVAQVHELLGRQRMVTVTGPAGVGKTSMCQVAGLSAAVAGLWFCDLTAARTESDVVEVVSHTLMLKLPDADTAAVGRALAARGPVLLLLDNCEGVAVAVRAMTRAWLRAAPQLGLLVSSRVALGSADETVYRLEPLAQQDAVTLLLDRVRAHREGVTFAERDVEVAGQIVRALDSLPLAIELASARASVASLSEIARTVTLAHQGILEATLLRSWHQLSEVEQSCLMQLSVFVGGFCLEDARGVVRLEGAQVVDVLASLASWSLIQITHASTTRLCLFETVRSFAKAQLECSDLQRPTWERHARHLLTLPEPNIPELLAAWERFHAVDLQLAVALVIRAQQHLRFNGPLGVLKDLLARAAQDELPPELAHRVALMQGELMHGAPAVSHVESTVTMVRTLDDPELLLLALGTLGNAKVAAERSREAWQDLTEMRAVAEAVGNVKMQAHAVYSLGRLLRFGGDDPDGAASLLHQAIHLARTAGDRRIEADALVRLAGAWCGAGRHDRASSLFDQARALFAELGFALGAAEVDLAQALSEHQRGRYQAALEYMQAGVTGLERAGADVSLHRANLGAILADVGQLGRAEVVLEHARALAVTASNDYAFAIATAALGGILMSDGRFAASRDRFKEALSGYDVDSRGRERATTTGNLGVLSMLERDLPAARNQLAHACKALETSPPIRLAFLPHCALVEALDGKIDVARDVLAQTRGDGRDNPVVASAFRMVEAAVDGLDPGASSDEALARAHEALEGRPEILGPYLLVVSGEVERIFRF